MLYPMTIETIIRTISLILAPVVMITSCAIFLNGLFTHYEHISARLRAMHRERLELFQTAGTGRSRAGETTAGIGVQRILEIEMQLPNMLRRQKLIRNAVVAIGIAISICVISMFIIALAAITNSPLAAEIALLAFLTGTGALLVGVLLTTLELYRSHREVVYEIQHGLSLRKEDDSFP
ncbi:MAG: DUF2721 domain-containing protein [Chloroflexi bacterium]|nr:MAG: DUF2721 domain-containing protein [Chloroflexota bacterium]